MADVQGSRAHYRTDQHLYLEPGEYGKDIRDQAWKGHPPIDTGDPSVKLIVVLQDVTENADGTITSARPIDAELDIPAPHQGTSRTISWKGTLTAGVWKELTGSTADAATAAAAMPAGAQVVQGG